jgi:hypothetical protein
MLLHHKKKGQVESSDHPDPSIEMSSSDARVTETQLREPHPDAKPGMIFANYWVGATAHFEGDELISNWKEVQATLGVVAALLLSIVYGRVGMDYEAHPDTLWKSDADNVKQIATVCNFINVFVCLYITITSARAYIILCMFPSKDGKLI